VDALRACLEYIAADTEYCSGMDDMVTAAKETLTADTAKETT